MRSRAGIWFFGLTLMAAGGVVEAQSLGVPPGQWWERPKIAAELGLTAEQKQALEDATLDHARAMVDLKAAVEKAQLELRVAAEDDEFNAQRVRERFSALQQARLKLEEKRFEMLIETREIITPAQWKALKELAKERLARPRAGGGSEAGPGAARRSPRPRGF